MGAWRFGAAVWLGRVAIGAAVWLGRVAIGAALWLDGRVVGAAIRLPRDIGDPLRGKTAHRREPDGGLPTSHRPCPAPVTGLLRKYQVLSQRREPATLARHCVHLSSPEAVDWGSCCRTGSGRLGGPTHTQSTAVLSVLATAGDRCRYANTICLTPQQAIDCGRSCLFCAPRPGGRPGSEGQRQRWHGPQRNDTSPKPGPARSILTPDRAGRPLRPPSGVLSAGKLTGLRRPPEAEGTKATVTVNTAPCATYWDGATPPATATPAYVPAHVQTPAYVPAHVQTPAQPSLRCPKFVADHRPRDALVQRTHSHVVGQIANARQPVPGADRRAVDQRARRVEGPSPCQTLVRCVPLGAVAAGVRGDPRGPLP